MVQKQYWQELFQLKTHIGVVEFTLERAEFIDRAFKIVLAIASSSSIGAWVIWDDLSWLWASIIALSQVISAITPYLPYKNRIKKYSSLLNELDELIIRAEYKWHSISEGELTSNEINDERFKIRSSKQKSLKKYIQTTIPTNTEFHKKAEETARQYLNTFYLS